MNKHNILIANRGEIALRIMQACIELGARFTCVYTREDANSEHCTEAMKKGGEKALYRISSYQDPNEIFAVADAAGCTAVHPGYGFFAEDYRFARRAEQRSRKLAFIGPSWNIIQELGDKINTKRLARRLDVPTVPGSDRPIFDDMEAEELATSLFTFQKEIGVHQPVILVKASAGGGGMGIEEVNDLDRFRTVLRRIKNYSKRQFRDEGVLIEQRIFDFNHLEVQILGDKHKGAVHFGTRNCTVQSIGRQKRIEVAPGFDPENISYAFDASKVLEDITEYSLRMAREVGYDSVGTWEWIISPMGHPFLMEVNTRIQVENGVSAIISTINDQEVNLLKEQIRAGLGFELGYDQSDIVFNGVGIEYRILAEDPDNNFTPWVGRIEKFSWTDYPWLRMHTHVPTQRPYDIPTEFDPNLALGIVWGENLDQAKMRGEIFLEKLILQGTNPAGEPLKSNIEFLKSKTRDILVF
ncbi:biotin carboxylase N-terminal domain-containing protein [Desulfonatronovibrio magnus]|uniref:ATP-binding protein n=1 Tax=Desulfonatronovibrio magnus TaxID=698827 RepID=UPI0005EB097F|nr:biotin carboxylase N-terminal domain-containing protein [Desulfonatronovibrio magnus]